MIQYFDFPASLQNFQTIKSKQEVRQKIKSSAREINIKRQLFRIVAPTPNHLYLRCCKCSCFLRYKKNSQELVFKLLSFKIHHEHSHDTKEKVYHYFEKFPQTIELKSIKAIAMKQLSLKSSQFYYFYKKFKNQNCSFKDLIVSLDKRNFQTRFQPYPLLLNKVPDLFITASPSMVQNFSKYGDIVSYDITYNLIKERKILEQEEQLNIKKWGLGIFVGRNEYNKQIIFAISIIVTESRQSFSQLFRAFFDIVKGTPKTILTDQQGAIISALKYLKNQGQWDGFHGLDIFHTIRNLRKRLKNGKILHHLIKAIHSISKDEFNFQVVEAKKYIDCIEDSKAIEKFLSSSSNYCLVVTPQIFQGISLCTSPHQKLHDLIKERIKYQKPAAVVVQKIIRFQQQLSQKSKDLRTCKIKFEEIFKNINLKMIRFTLCQSIFKFFLSSYVKSLSLVFEELDNQWLFTMSSNKQKVSIDKHYLVCTCQMMTKTGLPCPHIIKIASYINQDLLSYISPRWKINEATVKSNLVTAGRPRKSRRNK